MIDKNILKVKERISSICYKVNRDPNSITIVAVSKGKNIEQIKEVVCAGITNIGENRVQEALIKYNELRTTNYDFRAVRWHMVGHLQTNKVKETIRIFDLIHSVDSLHLASEINKRSGVINKSQDILIQVNCSYETTKFGLKPNEVVEVIKKLSEFKNIDIKGLMTIAPLVDNPQKTRPYFRMLKDLRDKINELSVVSGQLSVLSMGMTDDFEIAIEEGSNMVRLGRVIFEG